VNRNLLDVLLLLAAIVMVQLMYMFWIDPSVSAITAGSESLDGRNFYVIVKDTEQKICFMFLLWALALIVKEIVTLESHAYIFKIDLFEDENVTHKSSSSLLSSIENLPSEIKVTPLVSVISAALRRFALTGDVHSSAGAIEPAVDALAVQNDGRLTILRYITWAIPSIGFIGTVRGIGQAMGQAELAVDGNIGPMTSSLGVAFNSTFVALLISVFIMFAVSILQRRQDEQLVSIQQYVEEYIIKRVVMAE
jgi:biopolymer transport protein ExbB/TolQ